ncbi:dTDP-4-dehydrorhamnose reductase [Algibacillus agarilyticus]|uniref:dTDP-4-dehydrorhamnose reductase n=1 Tax=Algibacillus agarilyticus TaxID=2234133 RepID=UPI000DD0B8E5|nr:dTDP-4-dehydrorhamnose reductase [Algibacillus agarilyticus]
MKILLTGANGQVGRCFQDVIAQQQSSKIVLKACSSADLDITDKASVESVVLDFKPDFIVNAAAYTAVDKAEAEIEQAYAVNELGVKNLAEASNAIGSAIIHISTDYVFDGNETAPYQPTDAVNPQGVYGKSKLAGELACIDANKKHVILRTAWVFSEYGNNFVKTMIKLAQTRDKLSVVADQYGCPTYAGDIANAILSICVGYTNSSIEYGVYHYSGDLPTSWHGFARAIFDDAKNIGVIDNVPEVRAINTDEYPLPAKRPTYSVMDSSALLPMNISPSDWRTSLSKVINLLKN